ncbi:MAG: hypothetical protein G8345_05920 [Magnetococcales bacterium]|nr:hypothetical protein [Magnetococcales bacterium]NGZ26406.1 hypothetical protein [Magnetococcales bacterium]
MNDMATDLLLWARGPGFTLSLVVFALGMTMRLVEVYSMGHRRRCLAPANPHGISTGMSTIWRRFLFVPGMVSKAPVTCLAGYVFHVGFFISLFLFAPHIDMFQAILGWGWPGLSALWVDSVAVWTITALLLLLISRMSDPVKRLLSDGEDYGIWLLSMLPMVTGYLAWHHLFSYTWMLALHILSAELLLMVIPFTKLIHVLTVWPSRWYTGTWFGRKGVVS